MTKLTPTLVEYCFRFNADEFLRVEELPPPKKVQPKEPEPEKPKPAVMRQVGIADQIAIRSYVLGKTAKTSKNLVILEYFSIFHDDIICR